MPELYPVFDMPELIEQTESIKQYGKSWLFDFEKGDFFTDSSGRILEADEHQAWVQWCIKTVLTERFAYLIYSTDYGVEIEQALKQSDRRTVETELERVITEALLIDERTEVVKDFAFEWQGDSLKVSFTVVSVFGTSERIEVTYSG
ncbi:conserved hypothetical protein [Caldicellulosiruptor hydrothermalis 108]|uniref:DUF2634 domain-containing protein n=1 Tax=Caldicellulosiruptor hydrothermalis (strain DSM 18901 / VKM B-2411 / 108) TaxID=632292 RepID=E4QE25_CALH1|nr:DUF2634 domain-containing protein [Caldicellulosiruptor hydrothermalis]ADQ06519.1 conserved hypothetical protein [Caldicellulosiruptor hydrothermalis 108]